MSRKRFIPQEDPPTAFSSNEDDVEAGEGNPSMKKPETAIAAAEKKQVSDSGSGSEEEPDAERKDPGSVVTKTNDDAKRLKSSDKDGGSSSSMGVKRVSGEDEKKSGGTNRSHGVQLRVWFDEDEIAFLQCLIDYEAVIEQSFYSDMMGAYRWVEKSIGFDLSLDEFNDKIWRLGLEFSGMWWRKEPTAFAKPHSQKVIDLASFIWGSKRRKKTCTFRTRKGYRFVRWGPK